MPALYNEVDENAAQWTRNLVDAGHVAPGVVETRSLCELTPEEVRPYAQYHACSGIAVWSHALRLAGYPDEAEVWTASLPCQPWSSAGRRKGAEDDRHLWPEYFKLVVACRPPVLFLEQVSSKDGLAWLDLVLDSLEGAGYTCWALDCCAAGVTAPHIRQRLYVVAVTDGERLEGVRVHLRQRRSQQAVSQARGRGAAGVVADAPISRREPRGRLGEEGDGRGTPRLKLGRLRNARFVGDSGVSGSGRDPGAIPRAEGEGEVTRFGTRRVSDLPGAASAVGGFWAGAEWVLCRDGKARPVEPGLEPLAHGSTFPVDRVRSKEIKAYGNAIVAPLAQAFVESVIDVLVE